MATCPTCGLSLSEAATFCPTCGTRAGAAAPAASVAAPAASVAAPAASAASAPAPPAYYAPSSSYQEPQLRPPRQLTRGERFKDWLLSGPRPFALLVIGFVCFMVVLGLVQGMLFGNMVNSLVDSTRITLQDYRQLHVGQTYAQVEAILDHSQASSSGPTTVSTTVHRLNPDGSSVDLTFSNGTLQSFSQSGLTEGRSSGLFALSSGAALLVVAIVNAVVTTVAWFFCLFVMVHWRGYQITIKQLVVMAVTVAVVGAVGSWLLGILGILLTLGVAFGFLLAWTDGDALDAIIIAATCLIASWVVIRLPEYAGMWVALKMFM
jgi:hypothetical protein